MWLQLGRGGCTSRKKTEQKRGTAYLSGSPAKSSSAPARRKWIGSQHIQPSWTGKALSSTCRCSGTAWSWEHQGAAGRSSRRLAPGWAGPSTTRGWNSEDWQWYGLLWEGWGGNMSEPCDWHGFALGHDDLLWWNQGLLEPPWPCFGSADPKSVLGWWTEEPSPCHLVSKEMWYIIYIIL